MHSVKLEDEEGTFEVSLRQVAFPSRTVLFAVGAGGNPERHAGLLDALAERGCEVIAPHFERMTSPYPSPEMLLLRTRRHRLALGQASNSGGSVVGLGHSIGGGVLLALAGGSMWMRREGEPFVLPIEREPRLSRVGLFAPAVGFFGAPQALDGVAIPVCAWAGELDTMCPSAELEGLREFGLAGEFDVKVLEGAGHFSFMNTLPPNVVDSVGDRTQFLENLAREAGDFVCA